MRVVVTFEEDCLQTIVVECLLREQMWLKRLRIKVEMDVYGDRQVTTCIHGLLVSVLVVISFERIRYGGGEIGAVT